MAHDEHLYEHPQADHDGNKVLSLARHAFRVVFYAEDEDVEEFEILLGVALGWACLIAGFVGMVGLVGVVEGPGAATDFAANTASASGQVDPVGLTAVTILTVISAGILVFLVTLIKGVRRLDK